MSPTSARKPAIVSRPPPLIKASAGQYVDFAKEIVAKTVKVLIAMNLDIGEMLERHFPYQRIKECFTPEEFADFCEWFLTEALRMIQDKKEGSDPAIRFVTDYMENHCGEDISLEMTAKKINMSANYFSKYFKEKTGMNFSD
ncbi:hypothetical protein [Paenibacillus sp. MBLB4367]|uniref:hypothetical protein n=1 Tax=Paenibacillus sp. MBLB4367 TaxID=3384767 RepID=UPI003907FEB6